MYGRKMMAAAIQILDAGEGRELRGCGAPDPRSRRCWAELVAMPELWSCHGLEKVYQENAEPIPGPTTDFLGDLAR